MSGAARRSNRCRPRRKTLLPVIESLDRLHEELERVELWTAALTCFLRPPPAYQPGDHHMLPPLGLSASERPRL